MRKADTPAVGASSTAISTAAQSAAGTVPIDLASRARPYAAVAVRRGRCNHGVEEHRRIALHRAAAESWGEENADPLVDLVTPAGHEMATKADIATILAAMDAMDERWEARFAAMDQRLDAMDQRWGERLDTMDQRGDERSGAANERWMIRLEATEHRVTAAFERGIREAVTAQTRVVVISVLVAVVTMGGLTLSVAA